MLMEAILRGKKKMEVRVELNVVFYGLVGETSRPLIW